MPIFECARCNEMTYSASAGAAHTCARCGSSAVRVIEGGFQDVRQARRDLSGGDHAALVYDDPSRVAPFCARFLTDGVNCGERVVAALPASLRESVTSMLAADVQLVVEWRDPAAVYSDFEASRAAESYEAMINEDSRTTRILAGLDCEAAEGVDPNEFEAYEQKAHSIITRLGANVVCVYDEGSLPVEFLEIAARRHGLAVVDGVARRNERFDYASA